MAEQGPNALGGAVRYLFYDLAGHSSGLRGVAEASADQARRTRGKGAETRILRPIIGGAVGGVVDLIAPATYKNLAYNRGIGRIAGLIPAAGIDFVNLVATGGTALLTGGPLALLHAVPLKLEFNVIENAGLDALGAMTGRFKKTRRSPSA